MCPFYTPLSNSYENLILFIFPLFLLVLLALKNKENFKEYLGTLVHFKLYPC